MLKKVWVAYFTGTKTTKKITEALGRKIADALKLPMDVYDFSPKVSREKPMVFEKDSLVIIGTPTIAGRVPNVLLKYLATIEGNGALAVPIVLFGNRNFDNALIELRDICIKGNMKPIGAGAFIGEHSFSRILGKGRPDEDDMKVLNKFGDKLLDKLRSIEAGHVPGELYVSGKPAPDYGGYYQPRDREGKPVDIRKVVPVTDTKLCTDCKYCAAVCPMGSIDYHDVSRMTGICIKCCACIKECPEGAKYFDDPDYLYHRRELELGYTMRAEPTVFI